MYGDFCELREEYEGKVRSLIAEYVADVRAAGNDPNAAGASQQRFEKNWQTAREAFQIQVKALVGA